MARSYMYRGVFYEKSQRLKTVYYFRKKSLKKDIR